MRAANGRAPELPAAVIDIGGSGAAVWHLAGGRAEMTTEHRGAPAAGDLVLLGRAAARHGEAILVATPGQLDGRGLLHAANLGWSGLSLGSVLDLPGHDVRWVNDAAAIAAGERALHGLPGRLLALVFGTGLGVATAGARGAATLMWADGVEASHMPVGGAEPCPCGRAGCLELAARAWVAGAGDAGPLVEAVRRMVERVEPDAVVLCGGALRADGRLAALQALLAPLLAVPVLPSAVPAGEKSAAPHGTDTVWPSSWRVR